MIRGSILIYLGKMNQLLLIQNFIHIDSQNFTSYRKRHGVYSYKLMPRNYYKNPHSIQLYKQEALKKVF